MLECCYDMNRYPITVRTIMAPEVVTLDVRDSLKLASDLMTLVRVRHMPVVCGEHLVGIVSQRDLFRAAVSSLLYFPPVAEREWLGKISVVDVMTTNVVTARPDWSIAEAVNVMLERRIGCLPVVDGERLIGLVSETDCLRLLQQLLQETEARTIADAP